MPAVVLTDQELSDLCEYLSEQAYIYYPIATSFFDDLFNTGCRPMELLTVSLWTYNSPTDIRLTPLKNNNTRFFTQYDLSPDLLYAVINQVEPYQSLSLRQLQSVLKHIMPVLLIQTVGKSAIGYMFRYNYIKQLHNAGKTDLEIQAIMGWVTSYLSSSYYTTDIYRVGVLPPFDFNSIVDFDDTFVTDEAGNYIT